MKLKTIQARLLIGIAIFLVVLTHAILRALDDGNDINVYLFASKQLFCGENIYANNPYNSYLYSPFFALILRPISLLNFQVARVIWALLNLILAVRLWKIISNLIAASITINQKTKDWLTIIVAIVSIGYLNDNIILGQITIVILWLTFEGLYQISFRNKNAFGSLILAIGISIKIIPIIGLFYLVIKGKFKAIVFCICFIISSLLLPSIFVGHTYNTKMLQNWAETVNPSSKNFVFENDDGVHSLNALLPAYFYTFKDGYPPKVKLKRQITSLSTESLVFIMQATRLILLFSFLILVYYQYKRKGTESIYFYWNLSYLALISTLIFPHQPYYAMLYFLPAGSYLILFIILSIRAKWAISMKYKAIALSASLLMLLISIKGRDTLGDTFLEILNFYHFEGLVNLIFLLFVLSIKPDYLIILNNRFVAKGNIQ